MTRAVLTALTGSREPALVASLDASGEARVVRRCADLADLLAVAETGLADTVVVSADMRGLDRSALAALESSGLCVIGVYATERDELRLRQLGIEAIPDSADVDRLREALTSLTPVRVASGAGGSPVVTGLPDDFTSWFTGAGAAEPAPDVLDSIPPPDAGGGVGSVVTVWGPVGSPGRTTVAVNLAAELSLLGHRVLLVDADTYAASVAQTLALLDDVPGLAAAARAAERGELDVAALAAISPQVGPGFRVLTGFPRADRWVELSETAFREVVEISKRLCDVVVIDVAGVLEDDELLSYDTSAPRRNAVTRAAVEMADQVLAVGRADPVGLQRLVRGLADVEPLLAQKPTVVVTGARDSAVGRPCHERIRDALARFAAVVEVHVIPDDRAALDACLLRGEVLAEGARKSPARVALTELAREVGTAAASPRGSLGRMGV